MKRFAAYVLAVVTVLAATSPPAFAARDLCKLLKDKGILDELEFTECKAADEQQETVTGKQQETVAEKKTTAVLAAKLPTWLNRITPFGDMRFRYEGFYENGSLPNNRERIRARLGMNVNLSDELSTSFRLATGNSDDPISTNQTTGNTFGGKDINLNWAYMTIKPGQTFGLRPGLIAVTAGKFNTPAFRVSELVWDDDLAPEGAYETITPFESKEGFFRKFSVQAYQWTVDQVSGATSPYMFGGQGLLDTAFGSTATWTAAVGDYSYQNMNSVANKYLNASSKNFNNALANSNSIITDSKGNVVKFAEMFNLIHAASELNFPNPFGIGVPAGVFGEFANNTQAESRNTGFAAGVGLGNAGKGFYSNSLKKRGDWGTTYTYEWVEQDAVLSMFSYSDLTYYANSKTKNGTQTGSTNLTANIIRFDYMLLDNFQLTAKAHLINALHQSEATTNLGNSSKPLGGNPTLTRVQLDAVVKF